MSCKLVGDDVGWMYKIEHKLVDVFFFLWGFCISSVTLDGSFLCCHFSLLFPRLGGFLLSKVFWLFVWMNLGMYGELMN